MPHITGEIIIRRPVAAVFDFVADERNEPSYNPKMLRAWKTSNGPVALGACFRAEAASSGRTVGMTIEIIDYNRPRNFTIITHMSEMDILGTLTFNEVSSGTCMRWDWKVKPKGILKLMSPIIGLIGHRQEQRIWGEMKDYLEKHAAKE